MDEQERDSMIDPEKRLAELLRTPEPFVAWLRGEVCENPDRVFNPEDPSGCPLASFVSEVLETNATCGYNTITDHGRGFVVVYVKEWAEDYQNAWFEADERRSSRHITARTALQAVTPKVLEAVES